MRGIINTDNSTVHATRTNSPNQSICGRLSITSDSAATLQGLKKHQVTCDTCSDYISRDRHLTPIEQFLKEVQSGEIELKQVSSLQELDSIVEKQIEIYDEYIHDEIHSTQVMYPNYIPCETMQSISARSTLYWVRMHILGDAIYTLED